MLTDPATSNSTNPPTTPEEVLERARAVVPELRAWTERITAARQLPSEVVDILRSTGVFRMGVTTAAGGPGLNSAQQTEVIEILSQGDASAGWCAMIGMDTPLYAEFLSESVAQELFADLDTVTAGLILPVGRADRVPGGYQVTGQWPFGSGITHAKWVVAGCQVYENGELVPGPHGMPFTWRIMVVPRSDVTLLDTWNVSGLAGSGSHDYRMDSLFVPEERSFSFGNPRNPGPMATSDAILRNMPGVPLGVARAALDHVKSLAENRVDRATGTSWRDSYRVQMAVAYAEQQLDIARRAVYHGLEEQWDLLVRGVEPTPEQRVAPVLARVHSFRVARQILNDLTDLVATQAVRTSSPLAGWLADVTVMRQHIIAQDEVLQSAGAVLLGGTPSNLFSVGLVPGT
ncbi:MAG TPA: acyl-CoA dehydrogenase family protein [Jatrophihabitans sp.]|jgi:alkylation response protein AidB-like acyl-CoA dehydrogenase|uniref:acyl-CoA dehydrogenase family protein n=1 Tax=Jatrophihabitans sp. TaxID=1932789 RepID=UPI002F1A7C92